MPVLQGIVHVLDALVQEVARHKVPVIHFKKPFKIVLLHFRIAFELRMYFPGNLVLDVTDDVCNAAKLGFLRVGQQQW